MKEGEVVQGSVLAIDDEHVQVDIGFKSEGMVASWEFMDDDGTVLVAPGDEVDVLLEEAEDEDGRIVLSKEKADRLKIWDDISTAYEADEPVEGMVALAREGRPRRRHRREGVPARLAGRPAAGAEPRAHRSASGSSSRSSSSTSGAANIVLSRRALLESERKTHARDHAPDPRSRARSSTA